MVLRDLPLDSLRVIARALLAPSMIHELSPSLTETASGPSVLRSFITYDRTSCFHDVQLIDKVADDCLISRDIHVHVSGCQRHREVGRVGLEFAPGRSTATAISFSTPSAILR